MAAAADFYGSEVDGDCVKGGFRCALNDAGHPAGEAVGSAAVENLLEYGQRGAAGYGPEQCQRNHVSGNSQRAGYRAERPGKDIQRAGGPEPAR